MLVMCCVSVISHLFWRQSDVDHVYTRAVTQSVCYSIEIFKTFSFKHSHFQVVTSHQLGLSKKLKSYNYRLFSWICFSLLCMPCVPQPKRQVKRSCNDNTVRALHFNRQSQGPLQLYIVLCAA